MTMNENRQIPGWASGIIGGVIGGVLTVWWLGAMDLGEDSLKEYRADLVAAELLKEEYFPEAIAKRVAEVRSQDITDIENRLKKIKKEISDSALSKKLTNLQDDVASLLSVDYVISQSGSEVIETNGAHGGDKRVNVPVPDNGRIVLSERGSSPNFQAVWQPVDNGEGFKITINDIDGKGYSGPITVDWFLLKRLESK